MIAFKKAIVSMIEVSQKEMHTFMSFCYKKSFKKKEILSDDDKFIDEVYFIEKGILRVKMWDFRNSCEEMRRTWSTRLNHDLKDKKQNWLIEIPTIGWCRSN